MRVRRIAVFIDGGFFLKRLPRLVDERFRNSPERVAETARILCKKHVLRLIGNEDGRNERDGRWLDHVYRLFYYDARPYDGVSHHPISNQRIDFAKTREAKFREELFEALRSKRKFALRLGKVNKETDWRINDRLTKKIIKLRRWHALIEAPLGDEAITRVPQQLTDQERQELRQLAQLWREFGEEDVGLGLRQKGVDMRLALDIASITLKRQADTLILVTGDSDFVPAAKLARREGAEVILDPLRQSVNPDLHEHIDGLWSVLGLNEQRLENEAGGDA
jgi:uncharacterized LabA/DUF88 family protein